MSIYRKKYSPLFILGLYLFISLGTVLHTHHTSTFSINLESIGNPIENHDPFVEGNICRLYSFSNTNYINTNYDLIALKSDYAIITYSEKEIKITFQQIGYSKTLRAPPSA
jgi:hypothetical protein